MITSKKILIAVIVFGAIFLLCECAYLEHQENKPDKSRQKFISKCAYSNGTLYYKGQYYSKSHGLGCTPRQQGKSSIEILEEIKELLINE